MSLFNFLLLAWDGIQWRFFLGSVFGLVQIVLLIFILYSISRRIMRFFQKNLDPPHTPSKRTDQLKITIGMILMVTSLSSCQKEESVSPDVDTEQLSKLNSEFDLHRASNPNTPALTFRSVNEAREFLTLLNTGQVNSPRFEALYTAALPAIEQRQLSQFKRQEIARVALPSTFKDSVATNNNPPLADDPPRSGQFYMHDQILPWAGMDLIFTYTDYRVQGVSLQMTGLYFPTSGSVVSWTQNSSIRGTYNLTVKVRMDIGIKLADTELINIYSYWGEYKVIYNSVTGNVTATRSLITNNPQGIPSTPTPTTGGGGSGGNPSGPPPPDPTPPSDGLPTTPPPTQPNPTPAPPSPPSPSPSPGGGGGGGGGGGTGGEIT